MRKTASAAAVLALLIILPGCSDVSQKAMVGLTAPDFTLVDLSGKTWQLSQLKGQVVFVNFWATWCPPCLQEMPSMENLYRAMPKDSFKMLAVLYKDERDAAEELVRTRNFSFPVLLDPEENVGRTYGLTGVPETFIVDKYGVLREKFIGPREWDTPAARQTLNKYLAE